MMGALLAVAASASPQAARGQSDPKAAPAQTDAKAVTLFKEARALMEKSRWAEACPKLEESFRIDPGMGTLFNLADCNEHIGKLASAWTGFRDVAAAADAAGKGARAQLARERAAAIEPALSKLRVIVSADAATVGASIQRDGVEIGKLLWGTDVPVDQGRYLITAAAPGRKPWSQTVVVEETGKTVTVTVPALAPDIPETSVQPRTRLVPDPEQEFFLPTPVAEPKGAFPAVLLSTIALGGVGVGIGMIVVSSQNEDEAQGLRDKITVNSPTKHNQCLPTPKPEGCAELADAVRTANLMRIVAIGSFVLGAASAAGAAAYLIVPSTPKRPPRLAGAPIRVLPMVPLPGQASGGLVLSGVF